MTAGMEEDVADILEEALRMKVEEDRDGEEGVDGTLRALGAIEFLTQEAVPSGTTLVDAYNEYKKLSCLSTMWTVRN